MDIQRIIDVSSTETQQNLLKYIQDNLSDDQQRLFAKSFYLYFFESNEKYPVYGDDVMKWLGYSRKDNFKKSVEQYLSYPDDYEVFVDVKENPSVGGRPSQHIKMTVNAFKHLTMKSSTSEGKKIRDYYIELENIIIKYISYESAKQYKKQLEEKEMEIKMLKEERELFKGDDGQPKIYIFDKNINKTDNVRHLKIGITDNIWKRAKPFKQITPHGNMVFSKVIPTLNVNMRQAENFIHALLKPYQIKGEGENFEMEIDDAKIWIGRVMNLITLSEMSDHSEKMRLNAKLWDAENNILNNDNIVNVSMSDVACQTDTPTTEPEGVVEMNPVWNEYESSFDNYVTECCELGSEFEVTSSDIMGKYRIWSRKADKEVYHAFLDYLNRKFRPIRLYQRNEEHVLNGFRGIRLKAEEIKVSILPSDPETFIFHMCKFSPSAKILQNTLIEEYEKWGKRTNKVVNPKDLKTFLKTFPHTLPSNVWTHQGNGQGFYGMCLKTDNIHYKKPGTTSKAVQKRDADGNVIDCWSTIAKAAQAEGICAAKMSRAIKNKTKINEFTFVIDDT